MQRSRPAPVAAIARNRAITVHAERLPVPAQLIERRIYFMRGQKVMFDSDLADLYRVQTKALNRAVKRNPARFPDDFMFQLTVDETESLRYQFGTSNIHRGGRRYLPYAFTEHGVAMLSSVLNSERAVQMNIVIVRAFLKLREVLATHKDLARKIELLENTQEDHAGVLSIVVRDIQNLEKKMKRGFKNLRPTSRRKPPIGFIADKQ
jgi:phage regulator Rha-like protein